MFIRLKRVCSGGGAGQVSEHAAAEHHASDEQAENHLQEYQYHNLQNHFNHSFQKGISQIFNLVGYPVYYLQSH